jgi:predicted amidophosphoribosyltransferase
MRPDCLRNGGCTRSWSRSPELASVHSRYALTSASKPLLRAWKRGNAALDRVVLRAPDSLWQRLLATGAHAVTALPQAPARSWELSRRSPAQVLAGWACVRTGLPIIEGLQASARAVRQAPLGLEQRLRSEALYRPGRDSALVPGQVLLLVDDFLTTGRTARGAARALLELGAREVHLFTLGIRPFRAGLEARGSLSGLRRPEICRAEVFLEEESELRQSG